MGEEGAINLEEEHLACIMYGMYGALSSSIIIYLVYVYVYGS